MASGAYQPPLEKLLKLGHPDHIDWPAEFQSLGLEGGHIPDLIRMALDEELNNADSESTEVWGPLYAWRALGELKAVEALKPLLSLLRRIDEQDDDWVDTELPEVFAQIGPPAIPGLKEYLNHTANPPYARVSAVQALEKLGATHAEIRDECVAILKRQLENFRDEEDFVNGLLISSLVALKAVDAAPLMREAFEAGCVEETILGDWEDIQIELGLKSEREHPRPTTLVPPGRRSRRAMGMETLEDALSDNNLELLDLRSVHRRAKQERSKRKKQKKARKQKRR